MKILPSVPACQNIMELKRLAELTEEYVHPELIILFGYYAGMSLACTHRGYELLVITKEVPDVTYLQTLNYLQKHAPVEERMEKHLSVYLFPQEFFLQMTSRSYFFSSIRQEGFLLYRRTACPIPNRVKWKPEMACRQLTAYTERLLPPGKGLLEDAHRNFEKQLYRLSAFYLYQAALVYTHCIAFAYYGFLPETKNNLFVDYAYIRNCSEALAKLWATPHDASGIQLFKRLNSYKRLSAEHLQLQPEQLQICLEKLNDFHDITEHFCRDRIQAYREALSKTQESVG